MGRKLTKRMRRIKKKRSRRKTLRQTGGNPKPLLDAADAPAIAANSGLDFNVRFQPTVKASQDGNSNFTTYQTAHAPYPVWSAPTPPTMYTVICWDPDTAEQNKSFLHWLIVNCKGTDDSEGKIVASWSAPNPPPGSGEHRYIIGLFKQTNELSLGEMTDRTKFNPSTFATANGLTPIAYRGFRIKAADTPPPPQANPQPPQTPAPPLPPA
jgi:phosphatidylethanolamine-binding protein (PEBP) family uncharacterized protein